MRSRDPVSGTRSVPDPYRASPATSSEGTSFTCPHYTPQPGSKRCRHYMQGGACDRPDEFMCTEWLKANGDTVPEAPATGTGADDGVEPRPDTDLFGNPLPTPKHEQTPAPKRPSPPVTEMAEEPDLQPPPPGLTAGDIASFKALGVSVCLRSEDLGDVWLVPEYTGRDRRELTPEHAATIHRVLQVFPGSQVVSFDKNPDPDKENNP